MACTLYTLNFAIIPCTYTNMANTKTLSKDERKKAKRTSRKKAAPKAKRTTPRGSSKRTVKKASRGQSKR